MAEKMENPRARTQSKRWSAKDLDTGYFKGLYFPCS
jgi:hypothetical protein